ncbi:MAG: hypothetical protein QOE70_196 [Chthoniobacter sp.]|jgi:hypothetical protein|nr:hypothetical protein [Chthoniobacter sp.]
MGQDSIDKVLAERKITAQPAKEADADKFFSILVGDGDEEHYLELKMRDGLRICLSYTDLSWFSYDPEGPKIDLEFGGIFATIKGRGLGDALFNGIKKKRVAWIQEADTEMQDHPKNAVFIEEITFQTPKEDTAPTE